MNTVDIPLTQGRFAVVSSADAPLVEKRRWHVAMCSGKAYARRSDSHGHVFYMHREIMGVEKGSRVVVDHIDGNTLNNTRDNLRICTQSANLQNKRGSIATKYRGVYPVGKKWCARIGVEGKKLHLGIFHTKEDAAKAYDVAAVENFGRGALLNFGGNHGA